MNKKLFALLCISFLGNIHAMQENCQQNYITSKTFPTKSMETIKFSNNGDITFSGNAVLADFHNLKTLGFNNDDVKIVTANGIRYPKTLNPHEDLGAPVNCMVLLNSDIKQQVNDTYTVTEINPDNLTSIEINKPAPKDTDHVQDTASQIVKRNQKVAESINSIIQKITSELDEGMNDDLTRLHTYGVELNINGNIITNPCGVMISRLDDHFREAASLFWNNFGLLEKHYARNFTALKNTDIVKQKIDEICLAINHCKVLVQSLIIGNYRISFSTAFQYGLTAIDNMLPINDEQCRVRIFYHRSHEANETAMRNLGCLLDGNNIQVKVLFPSL